MTREEIEAIPADVLTRRLAIVVMGYIPGNGMRIGGKMFANWRPTVDRNDLAELLRAVPDGYPKIRTCREVIRVAGLNDLQIMSAVEFCLTCDPLIICRAVAVAVCGRDSNG